MLRNWTVVGVVALLAASGLAWSQRSGVAVLPDTATGPAVSTDGPSVAAPALASGAAMASCKPTVPLAVDLQDLGSGRWRLQCSSVDQERDVVVWMWSGSESARHEIWRGRLRPGTPQALEAAFVPAAAAAPVWAAVEVTAPTGDTMRSMACVSPRGQSLSNVTAPAAELVRDAATGELILQFQGRTEAGR